MSTKNGIVCNGKEVATWCGLHNVIAKMCNIKGRRILVELQGITNKGYVDKNTNSAFLELNHDIHKWIIYGNGVLFDRLKNFMFYNGYDFVCEKNVKNIENCIKY